MSPFLTFAEILSALSWYPCSHHQDLPVIPNLLSAIDHMLRTQNLGVSWVSDDCTHCIILVPCYKTAGRALGSIKSKSLSAGGAATPKSLLTNPSPRCFLSSCEGTTQSPLDILLPHFLSLKFFLVFSLYLPCCSLSSLRRMQIESISYFIL